MSYASERIEERRLAVAALSRMASRHSQAFRYTQADLMSRANLDVLFALKEDAAYLIEEGVLMALRDEAEWGRAMQRVTQPEMCA